MRRSPRCQGDKNSSLFPQGWLQKLWDWWEYYQVWGPLGAGLLRTEPPLSYNLLILGDALGAALPCCEAGEAFPHTIGKTKY